MVLLDIGHFASGATRYRTKSGERLDIVQNQENRLDIVQNQETRLDIVPIYERDEVHGCWPTVGSVPNLTQDARAQIEEMIH